MNTKRYVLGFMFDSNALRVVLIRKRSPKWQAGLLNGVGGKVEGAESDHEAMCREFSEETGVPTIPEQWTPFCTMSGDGFCVSCFKAFQTSSFLIARTIEAEVIEKHAVGLVELESCVSNLHWLIHMALDNNDGNSFHANVRYAFPFVLPI